MRAKADDENVNDELKHSKISMICHQWLLFRHLQRDYSRFFVVSLQKIGIPNG